MGIKVEAILIDLDDTLILTGPVYRDKVYEIINLIGSVGLDVTDAHDVFQGIEVEYIKEHGFKKERFPLSLSALYLRLCALKGPSTDLAFAQHIYDEVMKIYQHDHKVLDGVEQVLQTLRYAGYRLILVTKGDQEVQLDKARRSGVAKYFHEMEVVADKTRDTWNDVAEKYGLNSNACFVVGDSVKSDVNASVAAGFYAIHIPSPHEWFYEKAEPEPGALMKNHISELLDTFRVRHLVRPAWLYFQHPEQDLKRAASDNLLTMVPHHDVRKLMPDCPGLAFLFTKPEDHGLLEVAGVFEREYLDITPTEEELAALPREVQTMIDEGTQKLVYETPAGELSRAARTWGPAANYGMRPDYLKTLPRQLCSACTKQKDCKSNGIVNGIKAT